MNWLRFTALDWLMAWRHLRVADERPRWVLPLLLGAVYLVAVGAGFAVYATQIGGEVTGTLIDATGTEESLEPTPLQRYYGVFGGVTIFLGVMVLVFGMLSWWFDLLATVITMSVFLGCMALVVVLSLMSGLENDMREKILNQKAHIRISRRDARPFGDYLPLVDAVTEKLGIAGVSPYLEGEIMVRGGRNRQAAVLIGVIPERQAQASNLEDLIRTGRYEYLEHPEDIPEPDPFASSDRTPWRLRHLEDDREGEGPMPEGADDGSSVIRRLPDPGTGAEDANEALPAPPTEPASGGEDPAGATAPPPGWEDPEAQLGAQADERPPPGWEDPRARLPSLDEPEAEANATPEGEATAPERAEAVGVPDPILIGRELAMELGARVGSRVQLITPIGRMTPAGRIPGVMAAQVAGVFYSGMWEYDRRNVYIPLPVAQAFLRVGDRVSGIEVKLDDVDDIAEGKAIVEAVVHDRGYGETLVVEDWRDLNRNLFSAMFLEKVAMFIALLFVVLVASFGILASNLMSVMEKSKEIAILKAMGNPDHAISRVFVAEGLCVGLLGSLGGISMGLTLCWALDRFGLPLNENVYYIERLPVVVNPLEVMLIGIAALGIVWLSSLYPALVASRMRPVDGLRQADE